MRGKRAFGAIVILFSFLIFSSLFAAPIISNDLSLSLSGTDDEVITVIMQMKTPQTTAYKSLPNNISSRTRRMAELKGNAGGIHSSFMKFINQSAAAGKTPDVTSLWLSNAIIMKASKRMVREALKNGDIESAHLDRTIHIPPDETVLSAGYGPDLDERGNINQFTYGLTKIGIDRLAQHFAYIDGRGIVIGHIDTGVNADHPDLKGKILAFKDFVNGKTEPYDDNDHGTHTAGTIVGGAASGTRIGVAPGAKLVSAKVFGADGSTKESVLLKAMEWIVDPDGNPATKDDEPVVVSNSWGGTPGTMEEEKPLFNAVKNWVSLGIFPCFAAGNEGYQAATISTPGGYAHSYAVAASDENDKVASFSSRGPMIFDGKTYNKPDITAPGVGIYSSLANGAWGKLSGTSMATPHVSGLVALLYQVSPDMTIEKAKRIIMNSAVDIDAEGYDLNTGYGRINVPKALEPFIDTQLDIPIVQNLQ